MLKETLVQQMAFKRWANRITYRTVMALPEGEALKPRSTRFGNMVHTLNHVYVVDDIFRAHLEGRDHGYSARNTETPPPLAELWDRQQTMDDWWVMAAEGSKEANLEKVINFTFVGGGSGIMSRGDIFLHIVNHGNYHRGFVGDMLYQAGVTPQATDFAVFLRDT